MAVRTPPFLPHAKSSSAPCPVASLALPDILRIAEANGLNFRSVDDHTIGISLDETTNEEDLDDILRAFNSDRPPAFRAADLAEETDPAFPAPFARTTKFLTHPVFNRYHS